MPRPAKPRVYAVPALEKGLDLLEVLATHPGPLLQSDLARHLERSTSEIFRMLNCLERRGYIGKDEASGAYQLTLKLYELAHSHSPVDHLLRAAAQPMRDLSRITGESCHLSVLSQGGLVVLAQQESSHRVRLSIEVGARFPVLNTASGRLLLAHLPADRLAAWLEEDPGHIAMPGPERERLHAGFDEIRRHGVCLAESETTMGVRDVAVLVGNPAVGIAAALCLPSLTLVGKPKPVQELQVEVTRAAQAITAALGLRATSSAGA